MPLKSKYLLVFLLLIVISCKKTGVDDNQEPQRQTRKVISKITEARQNQSASFTNFSYDDKGRLVLEKSPIRTFEYIYRGKDELYQIITTDDFYKVTYDITFESDKIIRINITEDHLKNAVPRSVTIQSYIYQGDKLVQIDVKSGNLITGKSTFKYNGNILTESVFENYANEMNALTKFTFDDKKNVYSDWDLKVYQARLFIQRNAATQQNVLTSSSTTSFAGKVDNESSSTTQYTYDSEGYPTTATRRNTNSASTGVGITNFNYEYKTIEIL